MKRPQAHSLRLLAASLCLLFAACSSGKNSAADSAERPQEAPLAAAATFDADSAYAYVARQVAFGPRVPNTAAHRQTRQWLASELQRHGAEVTPIPLTLTAFDGTRLDAMNIFATFNPTASEPLLLVAHWDTRPWADQDPDPAKRRLPFDGANDGASGVGLLLELARILGQQPQKPDVDILFVDAEDWGAEHDEASWAMGARDFAQNPHRKGYSPRAVIVVDMVGGKNARFPREQFSQYSAPALVDAIWDTASRSGYADRFPNELGSAVTDDHVEFIRQGIPAIDIIEYDTDAQGFNSTWHTTADNMQNIDRETLKAVGQTLTNYLLPPASTSK